MFDVVLKMIVIVSFVFLSQKKREIPIVRSEKSYALFSESASIRRMKLAIFGRVSISYRQRNCKDLVFLLFLGL